MDPESRLSDEQRQAVEEFRQRHRTALLALLFTDVEHSTALRSDMGELPASALLERHNEVIRDVLARYTDAQEISTAGDSFFLIFAKPSDAVRFALQAQLRLRELAEEERSDFAVKMGIHLGEVVVQEDIEGGPPRDVLGMQVDIACRVTAVAGGRQILMTRGVFDNARQILKGQLLPGIGGLSWVSHGPYLLKGFDEPLAICEVGERDRAPLRQPTDCEAGRRATVPGAEPVLGWRPAVEQAVPNTQWLLEEQLGEGGFGEVWLARHRRTKDPRVFKFCFRADRLRNLKREMTIFRILKEVLGTREDIARLVDVQFEEAPFYVEFEYTPGGSLREWVESRGGVETVPLALRLEIVAQMASALAAAHSVGVIHKDVKPSNVLIEERPDGSVQARLTDFGIGQLTERAALERAGVTQTGFTETVGSTSDPSSYTGTRLYMAPELVAGRPLTVQSDLYSLGVLLYQLIVGDLTQPMTTDWERRVDDPLLREDLRGCLAGDPPDRLSSAEELGRRLRTLDQRRAEREKREAAERAHARRRHFALTFALAAAVLLLVAITLGYGLYREQVQRRKVERESYYNSIQFVRQAIDERRFDRAAELLAQCPERYRNWEWGWLLYLCNRDLKTLRGHTGTVESLAFSPNGKWLVTTSADGTAKVWDAETWQESRAFQGHSGAVNAVAFRADGQSVATAGVGRSVRIWNPETGRELRRLTGYEGELLSAAFSPDGKHLATGDWTGRTVVWDFETGSSRTLGTDPRHVHSVAFTPDGRWLASGSCNGIVKIRDVKAGTEIRIFAGHGREVASVAISPDGKRMALAGWENSAVTLWDLETGDKIRDFTGHTKAARAVTFSPDGQLVAATGEDGTTLVWDARTGTEILHFWGHAGQVACLAFSPDGKILATGSTDQSVKLWDVERGRALVTSKRLVGSTNLVPLGGDTRHLQQETGDEMARIRELETQRDFLILKAYGGRVFSLAFGPHGGTLATAHHDGAARLWDTATGRELLCLRGSRGPIWSVAVSPDGHHLATGFSGGTAVLWELATGRKIRRFECGGGRVATVAFSPDGTRLAAAAFRGEQRDPDLVKNTRVWDVKSGALLLDLGQENDMRPVAFSPDGMSVAFSPDGRRLAAAGSPDNAAALWDLETGRKIRDFIGHTQEVSAVVIDPNGKCLATGSDDGTVRLWDIQTGSELKVLAGHSAGIVGLAFSPDAKRLATASRDRSTRLWDADTGREILTLRGNASFVQAVAFSPDGLQLATGSEDQTAVVWSAFPWKPDGPVTDMGISSGDGIEAYKQAYWRRYLQAPHSPIRTAKRIPEARAYSAGIPLRVQLKIDWNANAASLTVVENIPAGWTVETGTKSESPRAKVEGNTVSWEIVPWRSPGVTLEYRVTPPVKAESRPAVFADGFVRADAEYPLWIENTSVAPASTWVFQQGVFPNPAYNGTQDTHIMVFDSTRSTAGSRQLEEGAWPGGQVDHKKILIAFDLSSVPSTFTLGRAELRLYAFHERVAGYRHGHTLYAARLRKPWHAGQTRSFEDGQTRDFDGEAADEGAVTFGSVRHGQEPWEMPGALGLTDVADCESSATVGENWPEWVTFDVTGSVRDFLKNPSSNHGWKISQDPVRGIEDSAIEYAKGIYNYKSSEAPEVHLRPMLILIPSER